MTNLMSERNPQNTTDPIPPTMGPFLTYTFPDNKGDFVRILKAMKAAGVEQVFVNPMNAELRIIGATDDLNNVAYGIVYSGVDNENGTNRPVKSSPDNLIRLLERGPDKNLRLIFIYYREANECVVATGDDTQLLHTNVNKEAYEVLNKYRLKRNSDLDVCFYNTIQDGAELVGAVQECVDIMTDGAYDPVVGICPNDSGLNLRPMEGINDPITFDVEGAETEGMDDRAEDPTCIDGKLLNGILREFQDANISLAYYPDELISVGVFDNDDEGETFEFEMSMNTVDNY